MWGPADRHRGFLSTPSARRATGLRLTLATPWAISIHALREEGDCSRRGAGRGAVAISIHALREEGDNGPLRVMHPSRAFLSTPSARRATRCSKVPTSSQTISIHALREEGDYPTAGRCNQMRHFYPRPPRGGRLFFLVFFQ